MIKVLRLFITCAMWLGAFQIAQAQNFSNRGKEFWTCFPVHVDQGSASIKLYIVAEKQTFVVVEIVGTGLYVTQSGATTTSFTIHTINPNTPYRIGPITNSIVYLGNNTTYTNGIIPNRAIRVRTLSPQFDPFVVYSHIYSSAQSDASLVLPVTTLGRDYYAFNYPQNPHCLNQSGDNPGCGGMNPGPQRSFIAVMAVEPGSTTLNITLPQGYPLNGVSPVAPSSTFSVTLNQGEIFQLLSGSTGNRTVGLDLTGTRIQTISAVPGQCKKIAVYTGSSRIVIGGGACTNPGSGDNLYEIMYPTSTWGKNYLIPPIIGRPGNGGYSIIKILASKDTTSIIVNGGSPQIRHAGQSITLNTNSVTSVTADKAINVAQYYSSSNNCQSGNNNGDPSMVVWSPIEQTLRNISVYSNYQDAINQCYVTVVTKSADTSKFRLDNNKVPFTVAATMPQYAYANVAVTCATSGNANLGNHNLKSDSGFISVAYGWGNFESYGYSSGANIKNLNQFMTISVDSGCVGNPITFKGTAIYAPSAWKWYFGDGTTAPTQNAVKTYSAPGKYTVSLVTTIPGGVDCDSQDSTYAEFVVNAPPVTKFGWTGKCVNDSIAFQDSSTSASSPLTKWYWQFGDGDTTSKRNPKHRYLTPGTYTVKLRIINDGLCEDSTQKTITIYPSPKAKFSTLQYCLRDTFKFIDSSSIGFGGVIASWDWRFGNGDSSAVPNPAYYYTKDTLYTVKQTVTSNFGCSDSVKVNVLVNPRPNASIWVLNVCKGVASMVIDTSKTNGSTISKWLWNFSDATTDSVQHPQHVFPNNGSYTISLKLTTDKGCTDTTSTTTFIYPLPVPKFIPGSICFQDSVYFVNQSTVNTGTITTNTWSMGDGNNFVQLNPVHYYTSPGSYTIKLVVRSSYGCKDSITKNFFVNYKPVAKFAAYSACDNGRDSAYFQDQSTLGAGTYTNSWDFGDTTAPGTSKNVKHLYAFAGSHTVFMKVTSDSGCTDTLSKQVQVYKTPKPGFTSQTCPEDSVTFTNISVADTVEVITSQNWDFGDGNNSNLKNPKHLYLAEGTYNITLIVSSAFCSDTTRKNITVSFKPKADFTAPDVCIRDSALFTDNTQLYVGTISSHAWNFGDAQVSNLQSPGHMYGNAATYNVQLITTATTGCMDTVVKPIVIHPNPKVGFNLGAPCYTDSAIFVNLSTIPATDTMIAYLWDFADGTFDTRMTPKHKYTVPNPYPVSLKVTSTFGCWDTLSKIILINPPPVADFSFNDTCENDTVSFKDLSIPNPGSSIVKWGWSFGNGNTDTIQNPKTIYKNPGKYIIKLSLQTSAGCTYPDLKWDTVEIFVRPNVSFTHDPDSTTILKPKITFTNGSNNADLYTWNFGDSSTLVNDVNPLHEYEDTGHYNVTLVASTVHGCKDSASGTIVILPSFTMYIPTAFTPNSDFLNDSFVPVGEGWKTFEMTIYDRWGGIVFKGKPNEGWIGAWHNNPQQLLGDGVFTYLVEVRDLRNKKKFFSGVVTLLR